MKAFQTLVCLKSGGVKSNMMGSIPRACMAAWILRCGFGSASSQRRYSSLRVTSPPPVEVPVGPLLVAWMAVVSDGLHEAGKLVGLRFGVDTEEALEGGFELPVVS